MFFVSPVFAAADCPQGNVAIIGDSLAVGIGGELKKKCPNLSVFATVGISTDKILNDKFNSSVKGKGYNTVMVMGGYNDAHGNIPATTTLNNLKSIYSQAKEENMTVVALTVPSLKNGHPEIVTQINSGINSSGVTVLDSAGMWATSGNVHDTSSYVRVANEIINKNYAPGTGTGQSQTPVSDSTGTTPAIDTTATAPTYEANPASLISGSTACEIWKNAFNLGISFIGVAALAGIIWGGFGYITSYGNQEKITSAKETIWGSVAGMFIGLFAYVLFSLINPYVLQCKIEAPFKTSGTTQGTGDGTIPGGNIPGAQVGDLGKCTKNYDPNNSGSHGYGQIIQAASQRFGVDPYYVESTIQHESNFDNAVVSPAGARTMGQFMPNTFAAAAKKWGGEIDSSCFNPINKTTFQPACLQWIAANPKKIPEIVAAEIARIKGAIPSDNYACVAAGYVGGPGEAYNKETGYYSGGRAYCNGKKVDKGTTDYVNNAAVGYNKSCSRGQ